MKNIPKKIYLQCGENLSDTVDFNELRCITWTTEKVFDNDIEYILKPANANESIEKMAKKSNRRSRSCNNCNLFMNCNMATQKVCSDAFIEGFVKGYKQGKKG